jgi:curved DNA-binding protein CbpA
VRIPLDYYRILGLPIQASIEQLQQAYRDRLLQLPRREYSEKVIAARKQLVDAAYKVLANPQQRQRYDSNYFVATYGDRSVDTLTETPPTTTESVAPSIEISEEQFTGALLLLQELGEYELVLNLGQPYLNLENTPNGNEPDLILTVALACLELGREQWQQGQYEKAASSLENGNKFLLDSGLFAKTSQEIAADLNKLRPYRILELLAQPQNHITERKQGLKLLQEILQQRGGIDGTGEDGSGLALDDFLRFIQQLRSHLTVREQQDLFETESQRPSPVANYLAVYALMARGFADRMPILIRKAKLHLLRLSKRQDVHLEYAVCSLLLGQTTEASRAVELSQEAEALSLIRERSQGSPDLLPGLCLYSERWLQGEVFAQFRDLSDRPVSLKDYFADEQVQAYLEALPTEIEATNEWGAVTDDSSSQIFTPRQTVAAESHLTADSRISSQVGSSQGAIAVATRNNVDTNTIVHVKSRQRPKRRAHRLSIFPNANLLRLVMLAIVGLGGLLFLLFIASKTYSWVQSMMTAPPKLVGEQPLVKLNEPLFDLAETTAIAPADGLLTAVTAEQVIQTWLSTKATAFGTNHATDGLAQILVEPTLSQWQKRVESDKANNRHREYKHTLKIDAVEIDKTNRDRAIVTATIDEMAQVYQGGEISQSLSYDEKLRVNYDLVRQANRWQIREMVVLK